ncbi:hypothetical protein Sya03_38910 [Spirilliplanes yamanashiensis]|uniref:Uncharacterized protein n=1 Tax=Spirilliplanes yamanashiensis TaxID=42233 RepID=A0A8J3YAW9_9ACTN|nr:hypothetical protein Sya03_38910 [Spirilliplanes yamanashiensis]
MAAVAGRHAAASTTAASTAVRRAATGVVLVRMWSSPRSGGRADGGIRGDTADDALIGRAAPDLKKFPGPGCGTIRIRAPRV